MSIVVRYNPPSLTAEQYDLADRLLREAGVEPLPEGLEYHVCFGSEGHLRVSEIWDSREQFEAYGKQLSVMPVMADIPFDSGGSPEIFEVHKLRKR
jgi:quinol monooxygenase YgiN